MFEFDSKNFNDPYSDYCFVDSSKNRLRRIWTATYCHETATWYSILRRSETDDSEFLDDVTLPEKMTRLLVSSIPVDKLPY